MRRDAAAGISFPSWKAWSARFAFRRVLFREQVADLSGKRVRAVKRAAAAEAIAQEANAMRLKALLDAAREQAEVETIASAERRFAEAKGVWQAAQKPLHEAVDDGVDTLEPDQKAQADGRLTSGEGFLGVIRSAVLGPAGLSRGQIALRSTAIASLILGGLYVYFDPEFAGDALLAADGSPAPVVSPNSLNGADDGTGNGIAHATGIDKVDIDPLVSVSWPSEMQARNLPEEETPPPVDAVRTVSATVEDVAPRPRTRVRKERRTLQIAPTPDRNPFYLVNRTVTASAAPAPQPGTIADHE